MRAPVVKAAREREIADGSAIAPWRP